MVENEHGEKFVGFLHVPSDERTAVGAYSQALRHRNTVAAVGAILAGVRRPATD